MIIEYKGLNTNKFHDELLAAGIVPLLVESIDDLTWVTYADKSDMQIVDAVVASHNPAPLAPVPTQTEILQAEIINLKTRLAKIEAVPLVKTALNPIIIDPIIIK